MSKRDIEEEQEEYIDTTTEAIPIEEENQQEGDETEEDRINYLAGAATPQEEKFNVHSFLAKVIETEDTTRLGNLTDEELGVPKLPLRTEKELELFCNEIADMPYFGEYFKKEAEILTSTSLSKNAKLLNLSVVQKREIEDSTKTRKPNKGWFRKGHKNSGEIEY